MVCQDSYMQGLGTLFFDFIALLCHHKTLPLMGATRPAALRQGLTNRHVISAELLCLVYEPLLLCPTRDASPPLVLEFCGSVLCLSFMLVFSGSGAFYHTTITLLAEYLTSYTNAS